MQQQKNKNKSALFQTNRGEKNGVIQKTLSNSLDWPTKKGKKESERKRIEQMVQINTVVDLNLNLSFITLSINGLNAPVKRIIIRLFKKPTCRLLKKDIYKHKETEFEKDGKIK